MPRRNKSDAEKAYDKEIRRISKGLQKAFSRAGLKGQKPTQLVRDYISTDWDIEKLHSLKPSDLFSSIDIPVYEYIESSDEYIETGEIVSFEQYRQFTSKRQKYSDVAYNNLMNMLASYPDWEGAKMISQVISEFSDTDRLVKALWNMQQMGYEVDMEMLYGGNKYSARTNQYIRTLMSYYYDGEAIDERMNSLYEKL